MRIKIRIENWELGMKFRFRIGNGNWELESYNLFGVGNSIRKKPLSGGTGGGVDLWDRGSVRFFWGGGVKDLIL
jgi:hypothetical protein